ncbi:hypothetical protein HBI56_116490 [Parastagonospora nodorum]|uniref:Uncharacterized protein n=1 Tax=Phaeosphaeria nodorum (strain SN15 / ATCC MYA-4574 / FGSC 10173) TaxID=321614 RepID=A0A7U2I2A5_PHANO|nr:hypothetical protein HBH56_238100 [Parastagonospora nodorum]QRD00696.1 hypothetical protein JI435_415640 [Parastagonospora nodorum SN15]KAH3925684.1 hypothetical protein HBH54_176890 [Parastagonospora nodorum]KAH3953328.1 hypothetical protein HBH53_038260 [Parastagonospora nodorum]KAH3976602.1 hypothetical protein HBH52_120380 [Parastagonospora nodorum]
MVKLSNTAKQNSCCAYAHMRDFGNLQLQGLGESGCIFRSCAHQSPRIVSMLQARWPFQLQLVAPAITMMDSRNVVHFDMRRMCRASWHPRIQILVARGSIRDDALPDS